LFIYFPAFGRIGVAQLGVEEFKVGVVDEELLLEINLLHLLVAPDQFGLHAHGFGYDLGLFGVAGPVEPYQLFTHRLEVGMEASFAAKSALRIGLVLVGDSHLLKEEVGGKLVERAEDVLRRHHGYAFAFWLGNELADVGPVLLLVHKPGRVERVVSLYSVFVGHLVVHFHWKRLYSQIYQLIMRSRILSALNLKHSPTINPNPGLLYLVMSQMLNEKFNYKDTINYNKYSSINPS
jgi:hypothetical protein